MQIICPICKNELIEKGKSYGCKNNHNFDVSKKNYINLLLSQSNKNKQHGDDKIMLKARKCFLNKGYYNNLAEALKNQLSLIADKPLNLLDCGAGEGFFSVFVHKFLVLTNRLKKMICVDISKEALALFDKCELIKIVGSVFNLPVESNSVDIILNIFAPLKEEEFDRVLKNKGYLIKVIPLENHLMGLKEVLYDNIYVNEVEDFEFKNLKLKNIIKIKDTIFIESQKDLENLLSMTPYYYKTDINAKNKLKLLENLTTSIEFGIYIFQKEQK